MKLFNTTKIALGASLLMPMTIIGQNSVNILGGTPVDITDAPYQVSIEINGTHWCGGTIISDR